MNYLLQRLLYPLHLLSFDGGSTQHRLKSIRALRGVKADWVKRLLLKQLYLPEERAKLAAIEALSHQVLSDEEKRVIEQELFLVREHAESRAFFIGPVVTDGKGNGIADAFNLSRVPHPSNYFERIDYTFSGIDSQSGTRVTVHQASEEDYDAIPEETKAKISLVQPDVRISTSRRLRAVNIVTVLISDWKESLIGPPPYIITAIPTSYFSFRGTFRLDYKGLFENPDFLCFMSNWWSRDRFVPDEEYLGPEEVPGQKKGSVEEWQQEVEERFLNAPDMQYKPIKGDWLIFDTCGDERCSGVLYLQSDVQPDDSFDAIVYVSGLSVAPPLDCAFRRTTHCIQYKYKQPRQIVTFSAQVCTVLDINKA